jgi:hypothetical protein
MTSPILSSATQQILSYIAHYKQTPDQLPSKCALPTRADGKFCKHIRQEIWNDKEDGILFTAVSGRRRMIEDLIRIGKFRAKLISAGRVRIDSKYRYKETNNGYMIKKHHDTDHERWHDVYMVSTRSQQPCLYEHRDKIEAAKLKDFLNRITAPYDVEPAVDTGSATILKALCDAENEIDRRLIEALAPELEDDFEEFASASEDLDLIDFPPDYPRADMPDLNRKITMFTYTSGGHGAPMSVGMREVSMRE